ncbi:GYDIA family GHMP kinase [Yeosuana marina]|uniref:GYDIA family GHMP kinase n=1 Tax=Yeosuana marina TaxID=1565536 RepID=UPI0030C85109
MEKYYSNGKLLLSGEYVVLGGAISLAVPTKFGQWLHVELISEPKFIWTSFDNRGLVWFENEFELEKIDSSQTHSNDETSKRLIQILRAAKQLNPDFLNSNSGYKITTRLDFEKNWGLGTSSTLINNIASWAHINAFTLLNKTFGGSGYDIACAQHNQPICYQLIEDKPLVKLIDFNPSFKEHIYFIYLNKKQNSRDGIAMYKSNQGQSKSLISEISEITSNMITCTSLTEFNELVERHEVIISKTIKQKPIKELLFSDFKGSIKSLGAWGGDFIMVTSKEHPKPYFEAKGYHTIISYKEMIL